MRDRGYSAERVKEIMDLQMSDAEYGALADWVLVNDGSLETLYRKVDERLAGLTSGIRNRRGIGDK